MQGVSYLLPSALWDTFQCVARDLNTLPVYLESSTAAGRIYSRFLLIQRDDLTVKSVGFMKALLTAAVQSRKRSCAQYLLCFFGETKGHLLAQRL